MSQDYGAIRSNTRRHSMTNNDSSNRLRYYSSSGSPAPLSPHGGMTEKIQITPKVSNREYEETSIGVDLEVPLIKDEDINDENDTSLPERPERQPSPENSFQKVVRRYRENRSMSMRTKQFNVSQYSHTLEHLDDDDESSSGSSSASCLEDGIAQKQMTSGPNSSNVPPETAIFSLFDRLAAVAARHRFSPRVSHSAKEQKRRHSRRNSAEVFAFPRANSRSKFSSHSNPDSDTRPLLDQPQSSGASYDNDQVMKNMHIKVSFRDEGESSVEKEEVEGGAAAFAAAKKARMQSESSLGSLTSDDVYSTGRTLKIKASRSAKIAAAFLLDYEAARPPSFSNNIDSITSLQIWFCQIRHSKIWQTTILLATAALFFASGIEGDDHIHTDMYLVLLTAFSVLVFVCDMLIRNHYKGKPSDCDHSSQLSGANTTEDLVKIRKTRAGMWMVPLSVFLAALSINTVFTLLRRGDDIFRRAIWLSVLKPIALFYMSSKARDALEAVYRVVRIVVRVLCVELFLILSFAAVACHIYSDFPGFEHLTRAFVSLFELSTTVVNPSLWMPMYDSNRSSAFFFILFVVTSVFYLHSLVLSVVFQTYMQAMTEIRRRCSSDREDALMLAFLTLQKDGDKEAQSHQLVHVGVLKETLAILRPHYSSVKLNALVQMVEPDRDGYVDFKTFRIKVPKALRTSLTSTRPTTTYSLLLELLALAVAVSNLIYVILFSSRFEPPWWHPVIVPLGSVITLFGVVELVLRCNFLKTIGFVSPTRLNGTFDGLAAFAAVLSIYGILLSVMRYESGLNFLLIGRSIDMVRFLRFFSICRDIVERTAQVLPAIIGPLVLVITAMHIFTYIGMAMWGGAVRVGSYAAAITPLYDLNNFNTYSSGLVTMFQVLVVNDWHAIAEVYRLADRFSSDIVVYTFFIGANLISVSILFNVLTAFFVGAFVTKLSGGSTNAISASQSKKREPELIMESVRSVKSFSSMDKYRKLADDSTSESNSLEFSVSERQCFDKIMNTVAGGGDEDEASAAQKACNYLEIFESLTPGRAKVGYMVCCQKTSDRIGNRRFEKITKSCLSEDVMHIVVSDMHAELVGLALDDRYHDKIDDSTVERTFHLTKEDSDEQLILSAALLEEDPPVSLFTARLSVEEEVE